MAQLDLQQAEEVQVGSRSRLYALLSQAFRSPDEQLHQAAVGGNFLAEVQQNAQQLPFPLSVSGRLGSGSGVSFEEMESEHIQLFDVGGPKGAPCYIYEAEYGSGRLKVMEDLLRFYHHFGLGLNQEDGHRDRPDHMATEMEFMHILAYKQADILRKNGDTAPYWQAQRDFLRFHVVDFVNSIADLAVPRQIPFYSDVAALAKSFCAADLSYLSRG